ncbi:MAG: serine O-acetyltransferase [Actinobacteria bacterium]|nr:serine O-acetyltransferase [Actinomycetota bacterium]
MRAAREDVGVVLQRDPAARNRLEVVLTYPGLHALWAHRVAHRMWQGRAKLLAKVIATWSRLLTGVEIHPGAQVGRRVFIDHGMGIVIGETAIIGDDVVLFHGVTLGGTRANPGRRHPRVGNGAVLGAGATVLGPVSVGTQARIGAGAVVLQDVPDGATAVGVPARALPVGETSPLWDPAAWI